MQRVKKWSAKYVKLCEKIRVFYEFHANRGDFFDQNENFAEPSEKSMDKSSRKSWFNFIISGNLSLFIGIALLFNSFDCADDSSSISRLLLFFFQNTRSQISLFPSSLQPSSCWLLLFYFRTISRPPRLHATLVSVFALPINRAMLSIRNWFGDLEQVERNRSRIASISRRINRDWVFVVFCWDASAFWSNLFSVVTHTNRLFFLSDYSPVLLFATQ